VSYSTNYGWSTEYTMGVEFLTGTQLNRATRTYSYSSYDCYALIWFGKGEVAILKYDGLPIGAGLEFDADDFGRLFAYGRSVQFVQVNGSGSRRWSIRATD
jgi:hypothetical protein